MVVFITAGIPRGHRYGVVRPRLMIGKGAIPFLERRRLMEVRIRLMGELLKKIYEGSYLCGIFSKIMSR